MKSKGKHVFISKNLDGASCISEWFANQPHHLTSKRLIQIEFIEANLPESDWVFFVSKSAIDAYFHNAGSKARNFAVLSVVTENYLEQFGIQAKFVGSGNDTDKIAQDFLNELGKSTVFIPLGNLSRKNISKNIPTEQLHTEIVYKTNYKAIAFEEQFDVLTFTSPSNLDAYLEKNTIASHQQFVAIGNTTGKYLSEKFKDNEVIIAKEFTENAILEAIKSLI